MYTNKPTNKTRLRTRHSRKGVPCFVSNFLSMEGERDMEIFLEEELMELQQMLSMKEERHEKKC